MQNKNIFLLLLFVVFIMGGIVLYYKGNSYQIVFVVEQEIYKELNVRKNTSLSTIEKPERDGYVFIGWYDENDELINYDEKVTEDHVYYARWGIIDTID